MKKRLTFFAWFGFASLVCLMCAGLYLSGVSAADAATLAAQLGLADPEVRLVFLTDLMDTRFDAFGVMRPLTTEE